MLPYRLDFALTFSLGVILSFLVVTASGIDYSQCALNANGTYWMAPNATFLYDQYGKPTKDMAQAWGISYEYCRTFCGAPVNTKAYDWNLLSDGLISWLLPWLALTAQLPFETKDKQTNFMALLFALGSPSLIIFSLATTILNVRQINRKFRQIKEENQNLRPNRPLQMEAIKSARAFLIDSQHIPIQIVNGPRREIAHLVACPENWAWWRSLREEIQKTKRGWTYSLYAQIGWVCVSQLLAIVTFFTSASFDTSIGIGLAINSLWIWMIPVVLGWVYVGTQTSAGSIKAALSTITVPVLGQEMHVRGECIGIRDRTTFDETFTPPQKSGGKCHYCKMQTAREQIKMPPQRDIEMSSSSNENQLAVSTHANPVESWQGFLEDERQCNCAPRTFLGFPISGCNLEPGPIFNYARIWSHMNAVQHVANAFRAATYWQKERRSVNGQPWNCAPDRYDENFRGSPRELSMYISELGEDKPDFFVHERSSSEMALHCITAISITVFLQWSSTGAAIVIAYK